MKRVLAITAATLTGAIIVASVLTWPSPKTGAAPLLSGAQVPPQVLSIIQRSCRDCHSGATRYPWYSYVYPVSQLITDDVKRGREHLDLSQWSQYPVVRRERALSEIANQVQDGGMPLAIYTWMHPASRLSAADVDAIFVWTQGERLRLIRESYKQ